MIEETKKEACKGFYGPLCHIYPICNARTRTCCGQVREIRQAGRLEINTSHVGRGRVQVALADRSRGLRLS